VEAQPRLEVAPELTLFTTWLVLVDEVDIEGRLVADGDRVHTAVEVTQTSSLLASLSRRRTQRS
jgi:hypothetical protein